MLSTSVGVIVVDAHSRVVLLASMRRGMARTGMRC